MGVVTRPAPRLGLTRVESAAAASSPMWRATERARAVLSAMALAGGFALATLNRGVFARVNDLTVVPNDGFSGGERTGAP